MVQKDQNASKRRLLLIFDLQFYFDFRLDRTSKIGYIFQLGHQSDLTFYGHRLREPEIFDAVVDHHLKVLDSDDLIP